MTLPVEIAVIFFIVCLGFALMALTFAISFRILIASGIDLQTAAVIAKALCFVTAGFFTPLTVGLAQWVNSGQWPGPLIWIVTGASCIVGASTQLLSFLSGSYSDYTADKKKQAAAHPTVPALY